MSLSIHSQEFTNLSGLVVIRGETQAEVESADARQMAVAAGAAHGLTRVGVSNVPRGYPVDAEGNTSADLSMGRGTGTVAAYHADYKVAGMP